MGNKIDLRGGEVTNEALEDEIIPIMNEFKVRSVILFCILFLRVLHLGSGDMCGMFGQNALECV